jgi:4a-hydroxytetrahydrobiopterin dehydratase
LKLALKLPRSRTKSELAKTDGWQLQGNRISKLFIFDDFMGVIRFLNRIARIAEEMNHHPDITINYNKIKLNLTTHDEGGLTSKDFKLARKINVMKHT